MENEWKRNRTETVRGTGSGDQDRETCVDGRVQFRVGFKLVIKLRFIEYRAC